MNSGTFTLENYSAMRVHELQVCTTVWWRLTNTRVGGRNQTQADTCTVVLIEGAKAELWFPFGGLMTRRLLREASSLLAAICFTIWMLVTLVCSVWENSLSYTLKTYAFYFMEVILQ